jgi:tetratricopeptide (TPR) repeat protein
MVTTYRTVMILCKQRFKIKQCRLFSLLVLSLMVSVFALSGDEILENKIAKSSGDKKLTLILNYIKEGSRFSPEKSVFYVEEALEAVNDNSPKKTILLNYLALSKSYLSEFEQADTIFKQALQRANTSKNKQNQMLIYLSYGLHSNELKGHVKALELIEAGLVIATVLNDLHYLDDFNRLKGTVYSGSYQTGKALEATLLAYQYYKQVNDTEATVSALNNTVGIYRSLAAFDKALEYQLQALSLILTTGDAKKIAINYNNTAILYKDLKDFDNAIAMHAKSLAMHAKSLAMKESIGYLRGQIYSHNNIGEAYRLAGKINKSLIHLMSAKRIAKQINNKKLM